MPGNVTRYLYRFARRTDLTDFYEFPRTNYEMSLSQPLRQPRVPIINTDYAFRLRGTVAPLKGVAQATIRFTLVDTDPYQLDVKRDLMISKLYEYASGLLVYTDGLIGDASLASMPEVEISYTRPHVLPVILVFDIWADFG